MGYFFEIYGQFNYRSMAKGSFPVGVFIIAGGILAYIIYEKINLARNLSFRISRINFGGTFIQPEVFITADITNSTNTAAVLQNISGGIFTEQNVKVASINSTATVRIEPMKTIQLVIKVDPVVSDFLSALQIYMNDKNARFNFAGYITADGVPIPLKISYSANELMNG